MMSLHLQSPFIGSPLSSSLNIRKPANFLYSSRGHITRRPCRKCMCAKKHNNWITQAIRFSNFCGKYVVFLRNAIGPRNGVKVECMKERFAERKSLVRSLAPLWEEGLLLIRGSIFLAVISGACLLVWYGQNKTKSYIETKLLPSVCSLLGDYIQREIDFGKVKSVSPLSITLESCSIGPHGEEFSCGEVSTMKLRLCPFASLRRGKIVIDAVLFHPSVVIVQKRDYSWLGIPSYEEGFQKRLSTEDGIDCRTKTRRVAKEELGACWARERDNDAKEAAERGYIIQEGGSNLFEDEVCKEGAAYSINSTTYNSFSCIDENMHRKDHHCTDTGLEYDMKHADLEKSFGIKFPGSGLKFWSSKIEGPKKRKFKRKANGHDISTAGVDTKRRILERSASAARAYFHGLSNGEYEEQSTDGYCLMKLNTLLDQSQVGHNDDITIDVNSREVCLNTDNQNGENNEKLEVQPLKANHFLKHTCHFNLIRDPFLSTLGRLLKVGEVGENLPTGRNTAGDSKTNGVNSEDLSVDFVNRNIDSHEPEIKDGHTSQDYNSEKLELGLGINHPGLSSSPSFRSSISKDIGGVVSHFLSGPIQKLKSGFAPKVEDIVAELVDRVDVMHTEGIETMLPVSLDSVQFKGGTLMLLAYGDREAREMENVNGNLKFQNHYGRMYVQLSGNCKMWRSDATSEDGGWLSADVFVDIVEQNWHANIKVAKLFAPLFERILEIPIAWSKGRATGEVHICMSRGESFPNLHGQLDVTDLAFQIFDAPSSFSNISASLCFRGQRIFLHNASGWFGNIPLEASGDFGIHPEEGEFHLMCQVPSVEVNALMKTFKMRPLLFPLAGSVTAVFNCQGPLDAPIFVGSGMVSRKISHSVLNIPVSTAYEAMLKSRDGGAVAAFDRVPFSYLSANFTFNTDNSVADLYGIRATLVDGGEIRGAGNAWICPEGEVDDTAMDINFSGNLSFDKILNRYVPGYLQLMPLKLGDLTGETKFSGSLLRPRFDIKWTAPKAEGSFSDARGDIMISHDYITVDSSSVAFDLYTKVQTTYHDEYWLERQEFDAKNGVPFTVEGVELDLRMRGFEFFSLVSSYPFDSPRPTHLKATGKIKFQGKVLKSSKNSSGHDLPSEKSVQHEQLEGNKESLVGEVSVSGLRLNQLMLAPQLVGQLGISRDSIKLDAVGRPDESLTVEVVGPLQPSCEENSQNEKLLSFSLQKGQLRVNLSFRPLHSATLEVRNLPLDELELASLRGTIQRAEIQLNLQKRRGHGMLSVLRPKFSGVLGEALDVAVRWSGDVITVEKTVLEQINSRYELQGEYVLPGTRDRKLSGNVRGGLLKRAMTGQLGSVISSMGRWRMRLEVPRADVAEMLPLARLLSRSSDPAVRSRSKDLFIQSLQPVSLFPESLQDLLEVIRGHYSPLNDVIMEDISLPGLAELKGRWHGSLDASGGGNGDTMAEFDFHGDDWEWGTYKTQRVLAVGAYSNNDGLRLERIFIQKDNATVHADGTLLGPKTNLHFAVLNFPVSLVPTAVQIIESSAADTVHPLRQLLAPIRGILHMEGDLRGSLAKPECDVQVRLLDGAIGGIDLGRAEVVASLTSTSRFLFNAKFEPIIQNGHVHIQGSVPINFVQNNSAEEEDVDADKNGAAWIPGWVKERGKGSADEADEIKVFRDRNEERWNIQLAESLKVLNWNFLDVGEVRIDADIKDGGMMMLTALSPYVNWLHGNADVMLEVRGTVEQPVVDGFASFHRASISSPVLRMPLTNFGGTVNVKSNRLCITSLESRVSRRGKLLVKGNLPLRTSEISPGDKIDLKCEALEVRAKNILSGQVDTQLQITGSILQPNISGNIKLSQGEAYLPHDKGSGGASFNRLASNQSRLSGGGGVSRAVASRYMSRFFSSEPADSRTKFPQTTVKATEVEKDLKKVSIKPNVDIRLSDLKLVLGPELRIVYPLILNFAVSGELELNGLAHPKWIKPKGVLTFENGDVNLVATQVRLKREHLNIAKFEPEHGLDPMLDLALVGSEWQFRIQSRASNWQDKLVVTSTRSVEQDALSPSEAARVFESQLAESILEGDGQLAFKKLATATLERLMPRIEGKGEFGQARWRLVYAPQIPSLLSVDPTIDPLKSLANNISFGTEVEVQLGKRLQASIVRQMKDSEMAMQWTLIYQLTSRLRVLLQSAPSKRLLFEYSASSQD
ncbi:protein TIC236, chloroplastic [Euphorbia lathyris]|uniref:protein TIC236, chloroplastic n=1 Tax=Euphorbia lathyris TaxID=212925 RepID=UPI003313FB64